MEQRNTNNSRAKNTTASSNAWPKPVGELMNELELPERMLNGGSVLAKNHQDRKAKAQRKREEAVQLAETALQRLDEELRKGKSETLVKFLATMSTFHSYSFNNQLLIMIQRPDATRVAGFNAWKKLDRFVKKGEKGIRILAPMIGKPKEESTDEELVGGGKKKRLFGFRVVSVFDVSQTDGKALPDIGAIKGDPGEYLPKLRMLIEDLGIILEYQKLGGPEGVSKGGTIVVDSELDSANEFSVLAHELAHEMLHRGDRREETDKTQRETEAEAVAFVVCQAFAVDTSARSSDYIQLYRGDSALLAESLDFIRSTATAIISRLQQNVKPISEQEI